MIWPGSLNGEYLATELRDLAHHLNDPDSTIILEAANDHVRRVAYLEERLEQAEATLAAPNTAADELLGAIDAIKAAIEVLEPWVKT
jgi:hypothetical protein